MAISIVQKLTFQRPTIAARDYITVGASGWPECFSRKVCDAKLERFVEPNPTHELLDNFAEFVELKCDGQFAYGEITRYLGRITKTKPDEIPCEVAVAFWGQMLIRETASQK